MSKLAHNHQPTMDLIESRASKASDDARWEAEAEHRERTAVEKLERERDQLVELLADIREWLDGQIDVVDGPPGYEHEQRPNAAMSFASEIDRLIGEYT